MAKPQKHGKGWRIRWTDERGERQSEVHPSYKDATLALQRRRLEVKEIKRGLRKMRPVDHLCGELFDYWKENRACLKKSGRDDVYIIEAGLRPALGALSLRELGRRHFDAYLRAKAHLSNKTLANHLTLLGSMLNLAQELDWLEARPRIPKPKVSQKKIRYLKSSEDIDRLLTAARDTEHDVVFMFYATAIYTGMRAGELAGLQWRDVDFDRRLITVHRSFDTTTKTENVRHVPILEPIAGHLRSWRVRHPGKLVFTNGRGTMYQSSAFPCDAPARKGYRS